MQDETSRRIQAAILAGLGELAPYLENPDVIELMVNPDGQVFLDLRGQGLTVTEHRTNPAEVKAMIRVAASAQGQLCDWEHPMLSTTLPGTGDRLQAWLPPVVDRPCFVLRRHLSYVVPLEQYVTDGVMTSEMERTLREGISQGKNILIAGGTGSGKTTLMNSLLALIADTDERVVTVEDTRELQLLAPNVLALSTSQTESMRDLIISVMRARPDRIIVGEVRDAAALEMAKAWLTHRGGIASVHATSPMGTLLRLEMLMVEAVTTVPSQLIAETVDYIVCMDRFGSSRRLTSIAEVGGFENGQYVVNLICNLEVSP